MDTLSEFHPFGTDTTDPISLISTEQACHITLHSVFPSTPQSSYKAFSVLVSEPNTSSIILTKNNYFEQSSLLSKNESSILTRISLTVSHNEPWVEISVVDINIDKLVLITAIELSLLDVLRPYHLLACGHTLSLKFSVIKSPRAMNYYSYSGLELAFISESESEKCIISVEVVRSKPLASYRQSIKFGDYSKQQTNIQTNYITTPIQIVHYSFISEGSFNYRMESHFLVIVLHKYPVDSVVPWFDNPPDVICYIELQTSLLSSLATKSLIKNVADTVGYLKGDQLSHGFKILLRMKKKDYPFMFLGTHEESHGVVRTEDSTEGELIKFSEELERVKNERDQLKIENNSFQRKLESLQPAQHLPSFSRSALDNSEKSEIIHKYLMLQQERDVLSRKCDQSKELIDNLYLSLEGYSELQESFSQIQESTLLQQEIVRHLQERAVRYKKLAKLCQNQEHTIQSYEEQFQRLLDSQKGPSVIATPYKRKYDFENDMIGSFTEIEGKSDALVTALQERLLQSSLRHRTAQKNANRAQNMDLVTRRIEENVIEFGSESRFVEEPSEDRNRGVVTPNIRDIINSIPKLNKMCF
ncbi:hypothetical protein LOD99_16076 [Oopsacas minuta]|uniref:Uncharacterized protein n=1 Tax=Oopsacas minuta TaxID=111878 RepID=A0AAV7K6I5_9METZ|nr:hypothetical protein LOD99_16076 [Oopsacas minuta]